MPFIVWSPDHLVPRGVVDNTSVVSALDLFVSVCSIANVGLPGGYESDGADMGCALTGEPRQRSRAIFWEYRRNGSKSFPQPADKDVSPNLAVREGDWKLLMNADGTGLMLYNLHEDQRETTNVSEKSPGKAFELREKLTEWRRSFPELKNHE